MELSSQPTLSQFEVSSAHSCSTPSLCSDRNLLQWVRQECHPGALCEPEWMKISVPVRLHFWWRSCCTWIFIFSVKMFPAWFWNQLFALLEREREREEVVLEDKKQSSNWLWPLDKVIFFDGTGVWTQGLTLLGRHSTTWITLISSVLCWVFSRWGLTNYLPGLASICDLNDLWLLISQDYRCEPLASSLTK
jgi:hypothetical protein